MKSTPVIQRTGLGNDEEGENWYVLDYFNGLLIDCVGYFNEVVINCVGYYNEVEIYYVDWIWGHNYWVRECVG